MLLFVSSDVLPVSKVVYFCKWPVTSAVYLFFVLPLTLTSVAACTHFLFHSKPVCSFLSPFPPFSSPPFPPSQNVFTQFLPHASFLSHLPTHSFPLYLHFSSSCTSPPPLSLSLSFLSSLISINPEYLLTLLTLYLCPPSIPTFLPSLSLSSPQPFGDSVAADVGMWACLTEFCMRGLSNFYSDSKKRIRTSYQSKSSLTKGWGTVLMCAGRGWGSAFGEIYIRVERDREETWSKGTNRGDDWNESGFFISALFYHSSHVQQYVLCRMRATPLNWLSKGSHKCYMIHVMYILSDA